MTGVKLCDFFGRSRHAKETTREKGFVFQMQGVMSFLFDKKKSLDMAAFPRLKQDSVSVQDKQSKTHHWVLKNSEVKQEDFSKLWIVTRLFEFMIGRKLRKH